MKMRALNSYTKNDYTNFDYFELLKFNTLKTVDQLVNIFNCHAYYSH